MCALGVSLLLCVIFKEILDLEYRVAYIALMPVLSMPDVGVLG